MAGINEGLQYLKSVPGVLKILEIIFLLVCIAPVGYFLQKASDNHLGDFDRKDNLKFLVGAAATAAVIALLLFLIFLSGLHKKIDALNWARTAAGIFLILAILLLVASSLVADTVRYYKSYPGFGIQDVNLCQIFEESKREYRCGQLTAGAVFGFIVMVAFIVDSVIHFRLY